MGRSGQALIPTPTPTPNPNKDGGWLASWVPSD